MAPIAPVPAGTLPWLADSHDDLAAGQQRRSCANGYERARELAQHNPADAEANVGRSIGIEPNERTSVVD